MKRCLYCEKEFEEFGINKNRKYCNDICKGKQAYKKSKIK